jgi:protein TonB
MFVVALASLAFGIPVRAQDVVYQPGNGVRDPVLTHEVKPVYTDAAKQRKVQGIVEMSAVVLGDGTVGDTRVTRSLDPDLDSEAIKAAKQWRFEPGTKDGVPVNVRVNIEMTFTLRDGPVYKAGSGVTMPKAIKTVNPAYDDSARQERIQGTVELEGVVEPDGTVTGIHVTKSLDERLDKQAMKAFALWTFTPGQKDGAAVRVSVHVEMTFTLK